MTPFKSIEEDDVRHAIVDTSPYKAPGPNGICNIVFKRNAPALIPYLTHLFNAVFTLHTYFDPWKELTTVVLRKPGKADYLIPKAYRPIALINTTCKLLTAIVTCQLTHILEKHELLPSNHFGGRPGRSTSDSVHLLEATITGRRTQLKFDDFTSEWFPVNNGIGQGDPLSMICYLIYNSDLVDEARGRIGQG